MTTTNVVIAGIILAAASQAKADAGVFEIDASHSSAQFSVRHLMVSNVRGEFTKLSGTVVYDPGAVVASSVEATIDASSIDTRSSDRDNHLRSPDFFDVAKFPTVTFKSKRVAAAGAGKLKVTGDLTMHGVTKEVVLDVSGPAAPVKDPWGNVKSGISATATISRKDFGMTWSKTLDAGGLVVGDEVQITLDVELTRKAATATANR